MEPDEDSMTDTIYNRRCSVQPAAGYIVYTSILGFKDNKMKRKYPDVTHTVTQSMAIAEVRPMLQKGTVVIFGWVRSVGTLKEGTVVPCHCYVLRGHAQRTSAKNATFLPTHPPLSASVRIDPTHPPTPLCGRPQAMMPKLIY